MGTLVIVEDSEMVEGWDLVELRLIWYENSAENHVLIMSEDIPMGILRKY